MIILGIAGGIALGLCFFFFLSALMEGAIEGMFYIVDKFEYKKHFKPIIPILLMFCCMLVVAFITDL